MRKVIFIIDDVGYFKRMFQKQNVTEETQKDNGKYESVEYEELMEFTGNANNILPDFQIYYIRALQLLADR